MNRKIALIVLLSLAPRFAWAAFPPPPAGFAWRPCAAMGGAILVPRDWHFREDDGKAGGACTVSREPTAGGAQYKVGLVINLIRDTPGKKGLKPSEFAQAYVQAVAERHKVLRRSTGPEGPFFAARIEHVDQAGEPLHQFTLLIANDRTGSVFLLVAEAPEREWNGSWPTLEAVIKRLMIDDEQ